MTDTSKRELIEEARAGLGAFDEYWGAGGPVDAAYGRPWELIRRLLAVFEQAHTPTTPTDEEREVQGWREAALYADDADAQDDFMTGWRTSDRLRRTAVPEPQGEPTDAQVLAALNAEGKSTHVARRPFNPAPDLSYYAIEHVEAMRAALRAAAGAGQEEKR